MTTILHTVLNKQQWHELRSRCITSTEVSALFGLSPYETAFELWHRKKAVEFDAVEENERMKWGNRLQDAIAGGLAEDNNWQIESCEGEFWLDAESKIGASADYRIVDGKVSTELLEIKNVDSLAFKQGWVVDEDGEVEAPPHIELQVQHQMLVTGFATAYIGALVGGNTVKLLKRERDADVQAQIRAKVAAFWRSVAEDQPPPFDPIKDYDAVLRLAPAWASNILQADDGTEVARLMASLVDARKKAEEADNEVTALKTKIVALAGDCGEVRASVGKVKILTIAPSAGTLVTPEMVGTYIGARKGSKQFRFYPRGGK